VPQKRRKRQRRAESTVPGDRLRAERPDHVWALDFQFDVTDDGRAVELLYVVDEFTREALAMEAERRIDADKIVRVLDRIVVDRGRHPAFVRCDNGPEMTSHALRDWCRFSRTGAAFIEPGSPWENPLVESFNSRVRDELLAVEVFTCLAETKVMIEDFRQDYNRCRPHRAHAMMTPAAFKTGWETAHATAPASAELRRRYASAPFDAGADPNLPLPTNHQLSQVRFTVGGTDHGGLFGRPATGNDVEWDETDIYRVAKRTDRRGVVLGRRDKHPPPSRGVHASLDGVTVTTEPTVRRQLVRSPA
jgi:putative transposase